MINMIKYKSLIKTLCLITAASCIMGIFTSCSKSGSDSQVGLDAEGNLLPLNADQVSYEGQYYIKRGEKYFPLCTYGMAEKGEYQWLTSQYNNYIPTFMNGDSLVYINKTERPISTDLLSMEDIGYSVGATFNVFTENGETVVGFSENFCEFSPVGEHIIKAVEDEPDTTKITEINGKPFTRNMIDELGFIHGLTEGAMYKFNFYKGTVYKDVSLKADTRIFLSSTHYSSTSYKAAKNIFYEVVLPEHLPNGYYLIPEFGLFHYNLEDNIILPNGIEVSGSDSGDDSDPQETEPSTATEQTTESETGQTSQTGEAV